MNPAIEVSRLVKRFNGLTAVEDLSFQVRPGELFGFLGPNGAGKTTTIHILCTLLSPTQGQARVAGYDCLTQSKEVRQRIGILFQDPSLDERLTAWENLEFHGMIYHIPKKDRRQRMEEVLDLVELSGRKHTIVRTFSGGMKRRLEVARALMHRPEVLFLDEPTIGLDPQTRHKLWATIEKLQSEDRITLFLTTHSMEEEKRNRRNFLSLGKKKRFLAGPFPVVPPKGTVLKGLSPNPALLEMVPLCSLIKRKQGKAKKRKRRPVGRNVACRSQRAAMGKVARIPMRVPP